MFLRTVGHDAAGLRLDIVSRPALDEKFAISDDGEMKLVIVKAAAKRLARADREQAPSPGSVNPL